MKKIYYCIDCNEKITYSTHHYGKKRCRKCAGVKRKYKSVYCIDCGKKITRTSTRCTTCAGKGKQNNNYKHGLSNTYEYITKYRRETNLKKFGLTVNSYNLLLKKQNYKCAICKCSLKELKKRFSVDHNHKTNQIRGLLCPQCNSILGFAKEKAEILQNCISYLLKYQIGVSLK